MELITGGTGYVGSRLVRRIAGDGRPVRVLARRADRVGWLSGVETHAGDVLSGAGLDDALDGCHTAYYLVHSMEPVPGDGNFAGRDRRAAETFAEAAAAAGLERIVYLGGIEPPADAPRSAHLRSRLEVERILMDAVPGSTALRASIVVGAASPSFRVLVRLVERLRVLPLPAWRDNRTRPIGERDVLEFLARTPGVPAAAGRSFDIAGPDVLSYAEMLGRIAEAMGVGRTPLGLGGSLTPPASAVVAAVTGQPLELVRPLMESLETDLLPRDTTEVERQYGMRPLSFDRSVLRALREWESRESLAAR